MKFLVKYLACIVMVAALVIWANPNQTSETIAQDIVTQIPPSAQAVPSQTPPNSQPPTTSKTQTPTQIPRTLSPDELNISSPDGNKPTEVELQTRFRKIDNINIKEETYSIYMVVLMRWQDNRLQFTNPPHIPADRPLVFNGEQSLGKLKSIWWPGLNIEGPSVRRNTKNQELSIYPTGEVVYKEQFSTGAPFTPDLKRFPYDIQTLELKISSYTNTLDTLNYKLVNQSSFKPEDIELPPEYRLVSASKPEIKTIKRLGYKTEFPEITYTFKVSRLPGFIQTTVFIPLFIVTLFVYFQILIDTSLAGSISLTLTTVALKFAVTNQMPVVNYMTLTDALITLTLTLPFVSIAIITIEKKIFQNKNPEEVQYIRNFTLIAFPIFWLITVGLILFHFLN